VSTGFPGARPRISPRASPVPGPSWAPA